MPVKKSKPLIKVLLISVIVFMLGYIGLDVPRVHIEEAVSEQQDTIVEEQETLLADSQSYDVVSVIDGDTFKVLKDGEVTTVRLIGIDSPETKFSSRNEECFGEEASKEAARLLEDKKVILKIDSTQDKLDKYGRLLAYAAMEDGRDFGEVMIRTGFAKEYTYIKIYQNQLKYKEAENSAIKEGIGLWLCK